MAAALARRYRWVALFGFAFVVFPIVAFVVGQAPEAERSDATILEYYTDSGNQVKQIVAGMLVVIALLAFLVFVTGFRDLLVEAVSPRPFPELAFVGGLAFAMIALVGMAVGTAVPATFVFSDTFELDPDTARVVLTIGNIWLISFAGATASLLVGAVSIVSRRTGLLPKWLEWTGLVAAPLMVLTVPVFGLPTIILFAWVLALSIVLLLRGRQEPAV